MQINNGWLDAESPEEQSYLKRSESPFYNQRPNEEVSLLVIHNISLPPGQFHGSYVEDLFLGCLNPDAHPSLKELKGVEVSAHLFIRRNGFIQQFVPFDKRAWHAGVSSWQGRDQCNDFSIGIEMEGADTVPYTTIQYQRLQAVTRLIKQTYQIADKNITGHEHIAPVRKTDPGESFHWGYYLEGV